MNRSTGSARVHSESDRGAEQSPGETLALLKRENPLFQLRSQTQELDSSERLFRDGGGMETGQLPAPPRHSPPTVWRR